MEKTHDQLSFSQGGGGEKDHISKQTFQKKHVDFPSFKEQVETRLSHLVERHHSEQGK